MALNVTDPPRGRTDRVEVGREREGSLRKAHSIQLQREVLMFTEFGDEVDDFEC